MRGNLSFLQYPVLIPFKIQWVFWSYDVPGGGKRGGHAFHHQKEVIMALSGSFDVVITHPDGTIENFFLNRSYYGIFIPALTWRHMENFSTNALALHVSDRMFDTEDYIRDFDYWKTLTQ